MTIFKPINENEAQGKVKEVFEDIKSSRNIEEVPNFWKYVANDPETLVRTWSSMKQVMKKGAIDEITKELIYVAVSVSNGCEYCIKSHSAAAIKKGATKQMLSEMIAVTGMANEANRLVEGYQVELDEKFK
ncbi:MAG: carboxymuconolactone decarboxylase family protein [Candidatus Pelagibacter sp. TMED118]|nr:MAG: carboxymuconolactone decarboxylase family protein [Candidatus Pelagibacter sp. TMED118]|tara:strand:+ start:896 stop:1288 length:393 start_codon:yes stop_codon:yes gene_type:complete